MQHSYIVAATYRSGSTLLCECLTATGLAGTPMEYFHRLNETPLAQENYLDFVRKTIRETASSNGVFGVKLLWHHVAYLCEKVRDLPDFRGRGLTAYQTLSELLSEPHYIRITRRDKLGQAISLARARQTGVFHRYKGTAVRAVSEPAFDLQAIEWYLHKSRLDDLAWQTFFDTFHVAPFAIEYETFLARREETIREILAFLGISLPDGFRLPEAPLEKTSDNLNEEWRRRFLELRGGEG